MFSVHSVLMTGFPQHVLLLGWICASLVPIQKVPAGIRTISGSNGCLYPGASVKRKIVSAISDGRCRVSLNLR